MRLGVGYNVFSGLELLKPSILCIRDLAHVVTVVYSKVAITGEPGPEYMMDLLGDLKREGLIDHAIEIVHPLVRRPLEIQGEKRKKYELARLRCVEAGCTHFMGRDCDEFFRTAKIAPILDEYSWADMVLCPVLDYVQTPTLRARSSGRLHVSVFHKAHLPFCPIRCPVTVDMSRTVASEKTMVLRPDQLMMHHMTGVRYDKKEMDRKFQGHTHFCRGGMGDPEKFVEQMAEASTEVYEKAPDQFCVLPYWEEEFVKYVR